jgi:hypothetical protein
LGWFVLMQTANTRDFCEKLKVLKIFIQFLFYSLLLQQTEINSATRKEIMNVWESRKAENRHKQQQQRVSPLDFSNFNEKMSIVSQNGAWNNPETTLLAPQNGLDNRRLFPNFQPALTQKKNLYGDLKVDQDDRECMPWLHRQSSNKGPRKEKVAPQPPQQETTKKKRIKKSQSEKTEPTASSPMQKFMNKIEYCIKKQKPLEEIATQIDVRR